MSIESEEWSVVGPKDRQARQRQSHDSEKRTTSKDESLIGSVVYKIDRPRLTLSDTELIGAPFVVSGSDYDNERGDPSDTGGHGRGGLLKLTPAIMQEIKMKQTTQPEFSLASTSDWPLFTDSHPHTSTEHMADSKSWSTVLKAPAPPPPLKPVKEDVDNCDIVSSDDSEVDAPKKKKKKKKKKKEQEGLIKDKQPLTLELGALFDSLQVKSTGSKKLVFSTGGGLIVKKPPAPPPAHPARAERAVAKITSQGGNILDSTAPQIRRGKEREAPKKHKPTPLRKVINKEKEERKMKTKGGSEEVEAAKNETTELGNATEVAGTEAPNDNIEEANKNGTEVDVLNEKRDPPVAAVSAHHDGPTMSGRPHPPISATSSKPKSSIHNRRFREYCTHLVTEEINQCAQTLLSELLRFQDRQFLKDPLKAKVKKRYVCGMREVLKHLKSKRVKCLIVAPNMERIQSEGGIDDVIGQILSLAKEQKIPIIFAMSRRRLALTLKKSHKVACVGVFRHEGAETHYKRLLELVEEAKEQYSTRSTALQAAAIHPALALADSGSDEENDSIMQNENETVNSTDLMRSPWAVFFKQQQAKQTGTSPSDVHIPSVSASKDLLPPHTPHSHMTDVGDHVTSPFNVFAKEFVPTSLNVHAPEFCPEV